MRKRLVSDGMDVIGNDAVGNAFYQDIVGSTDETVSVCLIGRIAIGDRYFG